MRVVFDIQGCQSEGSRNRGIGRYSISLIRNIIINNPENEYILFANSNLYNVKSLFIDLISSDKYDVKYFQWYSPGPLNDQHLGDSSKAWYAVQARSYALSLINCDIVLITSFFEGFLDNCITEFDTSYKLPPIALILYDLIPLIYKDLYLDTNIDFKSYYLKSIQKLSDIDGLLVISKSVLHEANQYLNFNSDYLFNISSGCDIELFNLNVPELSFDYRDKIKSSKYILYSGAGDPRKNLHRLIEAYSNLHSSILSQYKLVLVGKLIPEEIAQINTLIDQFNLPTDSLVLLGYVSDKVLASLYRSCSLFVFPSLHEGFGLPVLEAMNCGAPVIASNTSSIPEIIDLPSCLFDPQDIKQMTSLITKALIDINFNKELRRNSLLRKDCFSWNQSSKIAFQSLSKIANIKKDFDTSDVVINRSSKYDFFINKISNNLMINSKMSTDDVFLQEFCSSISLISKQINSLPKKKIDISTLNWIVEGPFDSTYSLAILNKNYALALKELGLKILVSSMEGDGLFQASHDFLIANPEISEIYDPQKVENLRSHLSVNTRNMFPPTVNNMSSVLNVFHAYGWEETSFPSDWIENFNYYLDGITVMSSFVKKILIDNGCNLPISVCSLGIDHLNSIEPDSNFTVNANKFKFLHISSCFPRKGIDVLLESYGEAFSSTDDVSLIIKTFANPHNQLDLLLEKHKESNPTFPHVVVINQDLSQSSLKSLYKLSNVLVAPSFGEGFALPVAEAMSLGLPVITTNFGGQLDFCNEQNCWLLDYQLEYSNSHFKLTNSAWAKPCSKHLISLLRETYSINQDKHIDKVDKAMSEIKNFKWINVAKKNLYFIENLSNKDRGRPLKVGWISTWNEKCGIASYSKNLISHFENEVTIFANKNTLLLSKDSENVCRCWILESDMDKLFKKVVENNISTLIIQFNFGFFDLPLFNQFILKLIQKRIHIIIFMHSTIEPNKPNKKLSMISSFSNVSRVIVHTLGDYNRLKRAGFTENITLFPHGINVYPSVISSKDESNHNFEKIKLISSFGFCLPNKGFKELILAINNLRSTGLNIRLNLYSSIYSEYYKDYIDELIGLIERLNLSNEISLETEFLEESKIVSLLSLSDLVIFPNQNSNESSSAAVRVGLASSKPVLVTPIKLFDDVKEIVHYLPGTSVSAIEEGINTFYAKQIKSEKETIYKRRWLEQNNFEKLSLRLEGMIEGIEVNSNYY